MAHQYLRPVQVLVRGGMPAEFRWHGELYTVAEVLTTWHLQDRWWTPLGESNPRRAASDRTYYRVRCPDQQCFDLYHDAVSGLWVLNRAHD